MYARVGNDSWIHYTIRTTRTDGQVSFTSRYKSSVLDNPRGANLSNLGATLSINNSWT